jgi:hypothetical protein
VTKTLFPVAIVVTIASFYFCSRGGRSENNKQDGADERHKSRPAELATIRSGQKMLPRLFRDTGLCNLTSRREKENGFDLLTHFSHCNFSSKWNFFFVFLFLSTFSTSKPSFSAFEAQNLIASCF